MKKFLFLLALSALARKVFGSGKDNQSAAAEARTH
jgi:hypothetical protein